jgi:nucleoside-diphosphate-sugar epimerase
MSLLITGGLGFLGLQTASALLRRGVVWSPLFKQPVSIKKITLFDIPAAISAGAASVPKELREDPRVAIKTGDLGEEGIAAELIDDDDLSIVHLASMVSGDTEADPDRGWRVNVEGQRALLEAVKLPLHLLDSHTRPGARGTHRGRQHQAAARQHLRIPQGSMRADDQ